MPADQTAPSRTAARAHRNSVEISEKDLAKALRTKLGTRLLSFVVSRDASTVSRWSSSDATPPDEAVRTMRTAYHVFDLLENSEADATIRAWFIGMNPQLDDVSPIEALKEGRHREVMAAARAFMAGG